MRGKSKNHIEGKRTKEREKGSSELEQLRQRKRLGCVPNRLLESLQRVPSRLIYGIVG